MNEWSDGKSLRRVSGGAVLLGLFLLLDGITLSGITDEKRFSKTKSALIFDLQSFQPNRIKIDVENNGMYVSWRRNGQAGMEWPAGSGRTVVFTAGFWLVGKVGEEIRTAIAEFESQYQPGTARNGVPQDPHSPRFRNYIITAEDRLAAADQDPATIPSRDYLEWPFADGAPALKASDGTDSLDAEGHRIPLLVGDQALWCVFNDLDPEGRSRLWPRATSPPMGVEVQMYAWGYRTIALRDLLFLRFQVNHRGSSELDSVFVGMYADPDLGWPADDIVGIDTVLQVAYTWNDGPDRMYGVRTPAVGQFLLQGPLAPAVRDTGRAFGASQPGFENRPFYAFDAFFGGGGYTFGAPETPLEAFNILRGLGRGGLGYVDPTTGQITRFVGSGDPVTGSGWLLWLSTDMQCLASIGPFHLAPSDSQEVIIALIVGQGRDYLDSITQMRQAARAAFVFYDHDFRFPDVQPPAPRVRVSASEGEVVLSWDRSVQSFERRLRTGRHPKALPIHYRFEGYNIYQLSKPEVDETTEVVRVASFDLDNGLAEISDLVYDPQADDYLIRPVQQAPDAGVQRYVRIRWDRLRDHPLIYGREYYFAVRSYAVDLGAPSKYGFPRVVESPLSVVAVTPRRPLAGAVYGAAVGDTLAVTHVSGESTGQVLPVVLHPEDLTGKIYRVGFDSVGAELVWYLERQDGSLPVMAWRNQSGDEDYPVVDGILVKVVDSAEQPNTVADEFTFETPVPVQGDRRAALAELEKINVFPNPYYARNADEIDPLNRFVTFTHLPERATIRIFTLAGDLVRRLEHDDRTTFHRWDLRNEAGVAVASGIYLALIDMPGLGQKVLKLAVFQPVEIPEFYTSTPTLGGQLWEKRKP